MLWCCGLRVEDREGEGLGSQGLTREACGLRVTMIIGQTGRYLERRRALSPLSSVSIFSAPIRSVIYTQY